MKKILLSIIIVVTIALMPGIASAHVLKTDGSIGAVLHVDPADDPEIGKPATFFFEFKDKENKFSLDKCDCRAFIVKGGQEVYSNSLAGSSGLDSPLFQYTFTERGIYTVKATGQSKVPGAFQPFSLSYDVRVERGEVSTAASPSGAASGGGHLLHFILLGGAFAVIFGKYFFDVLKKKRQQNKSGKQIVVGLLAAFTLFGLLFHQVHAAGSNCAGETLPSAHECCLPVLADTSASLTVERLPSTQDIVTKLFQGVNAAPNESINNKSPPIA